MLEILQKLLETNSSPKVEAAKIPAILCLIGLLTTYISDKIPQEVTEKGIIQVIGLVIIAIGTTLLFFNIIGNIFNVSIISGISDGIISGLISVFIVSALIFAPIENQSEENLYIYRIAITLSYGMIYGAILGLFLSFFDKNSKIDIVKHLTLIASIMIISIYFLSEFLFDKIPGVPQDPMTAGQIFITHSIFIITFTAMYTKNIKTRKTIRPIILFFTTTVIISIILCTLKQNIFFPSHYGLDEEPLWRMTFYTGDIPSTYAFSAVMVTFTIYAAINIIYAMRLLCNIQEAPSTTII